MHVWSVDLEIELQYYPMINKTLTPIWFWLKMYGQYYSVVLTTKGFIGWLNFGCTTESTKIKLPNLTLPNTCNMSCVTDNVYKWRST